MKVFMQKINRLVVIAMELILAIVIIVKPFEFSNGIIVVMGILLSFLGVIDIVSYFRSNVTIGILERSLTKGLLFLLGGIVIILTTDKLASYLPTVYALLILIGGVSKIQTALDMLRMKQKLWYYVIIGAGISLVLTTLILTNPFFAPDSSSYYLFIGIALVVEAVINAIVFFMSKAWNNYDLAEIQNMQRAGE